MNRTTQILHFVIYMTNKLVEICISLIILIEKQHTTKCLIDYKLSL